jgi:hypothetical protein
MDPTASLLNQYSSIEKFLWDGVASVNTELLVNSDDSATRWSEVQAIGHAIIWNITTGSAANTGELNLFVGVTYKQDPGNVQLLTLLDKVKALLDTSAEIAVYDYATGVPTVKVNSLVPVKNVNFWPVVIEADGFKTKMLSQKLKYAQKRS